MRACKQTPPCKQTLAVDQSWKFPYTYRKSQVCQSMVLTQRRKVYSLAVTKEVNLWAVFKFKVFYTEKQNNFIK